ncbi:MucBP domain-containing protein [Lentilactobacillus kisonensis]|uniref:MucBP domain-containing protein n=1 Tax=Lentilactobacillus kisonensis TaxID=481722 RepID=UPI000B306662|nr:MucBP domain-containing protein [Lentilactobacillus kisonensis]
MIHEDADDNNKVIGKTDQINGQFGETKAIPSQSISGYTPDNANPTSFKLGTLDKDGSTQDTIILYYHKASSVTGGGSSSTTTQPAGHPVPLPNQLLQLIISGHQLPANHLQHQQQTMGWLPRRAKLFIL